MQVIVENNTLICQFPKEINSIILRKVSCKISTILDCSRINTIIFDFKQVTYVSSFFLNMIVITRKKCIKYDFSIINVNSHEVENTLEKSGLAKLFNIYKNT